MQKVMFATHYGQPESTKLKDALGDWIAGARAGHDRGRRRYRGYLATNTGYKKRNQPC